MEPIENLKLIQKQIEQLTRENEKLRGIKDSYVKNAERLNEYTGEFETFADQFVKKLKELAKRIDPVLEWGERRERVHNPRLKEIAQEVYSKMVDNGLHVTRNLFEKTYQDLNPTEISRLLVKLEDFPDVEKAKDKGAIRLYCRSG